MKNKKTWLNILIYSIYFLSGLGIFIFLSYNAFFKISGVVAFSLIFARTCVLTASKPLNPFCHNNGLKYLYQKKNDLAGYEKRVKRAEKALIIIGVIFLFSGAIEQLITTSISS